MRISATPYALRTMEDNDIDWVFRGLSDPKVYQYYGVRYHSLEAAESQMAWYDNLLEEHSGIWFAILDKSEQPVGAIGLNDYVHTHRKAEIGYWLLPECWGEGIVKGVIGPVLEYGFTQWQLHRIEAFVETGNVASGRILKDIGFKMEGVQRECEFKDDAFISLEMYSMLAREFHSE